ncbi:MAG TPA: GH116 family glycosyl hydrolase [Candidatus Brocadiia bacterium]|nr:GH116 family glycosyl hydrolase [Candidatus Brocadiia bacterium]
MNTTGLASLVLNCLAGCHGVSSSGGKSPSPCAIRNSIGHASGIPLGGLGTGSVEIRSDGYFHEWQIFNLGAWAPQQPKCCSAAPQPDMGPGALSFLVRARKEGSAMPIARRLGVRSDQHNLYSFAWLKSVREIAFDGRYPAAELSYLDEDLPVAVSAKMFSPFVPHESRTSGTPGFYMVFRVKNLSSEPVEASIMGALRNPLAWGAEDRKLSNSVSQAKGTTFLTMRTGADMPCKMTLGSVGMSVTGGDASWVAGEFPENMTGFVTWETTYGMSHESLLHDFRASGRLFETDGARSPAGLLQISDEEIDGLTDAERQKLLKEIRRYAFVQSLWNRVAQVDAKMLESKEGAATFLKEIRTRLNWMTGKDRKRQSWGDGALCASISLAPLEEKEIRFTFAWYFPFHFSADGPVLGHMYENWFKDAEDVNRFLADNYATAGRKTLAFSETLHDATLEPEMVYAWSSQLTTMPKCTWWTKKGDFAVWEGLGCCGFHTTDITYQGSFSILALFPDLQMSQMELGARFQREDGRVHHFFTPDFSKVDNGFDRVDMNQQFILLVCRDYLWTGDKNYLRRLWPNIVRAMDNTAQLDKDGDGLPDHDTRRNTYDAWNFFGTPSYIASLWLSALLAAIRIAEDLGKRKEAANWRGILENASVNFDRKLWNGEYYSLWVDGDNRDECCMSDQIDGEWFTQLIGIGHCLPRERVIAALRAAMKYNFNEEDGLINANYPSGSALRLSTYRNLQATAPWTGIEYAIASMMLDFGMVAEGRAVIRNIYERYARAGRLWNHVECGDHYYRAMSGWAVLLAATGFKVDVPAQRLSVAPVVAGVELRFPWVAASGWGRFAQTDTGCELKCEAGAVVLKELRLSLKAGKLGACLNGRKLDCSCSTKDGLTLIKLKTAATIREGDTLTIGQSFMRLRLTKR